MHDPRAVELNAEGSVVRIHSRAQQLLEEGWISCSDTKIVPVAGSVQDVFAQTLAQTLDQPTAGLPPLVLCIPMADGSAGGTVLFYATPGDEDRRVVLILQSDALVRPQKEDLMRLFGVTKAEASLLADLVIGLDVVAHAERRGISTHTVRSTMKSIFVKTQSHRQVDLVQRVTRALNSIL